MDEKKNMNICVRLKGCGTGLESLDEWIQAGLSGSFEVISGTPSVRRLGTRVVKMCSKENTLR